jgi:hypothetical protein
MTAMTEQEAIRVLRDLLGRVSDGIAGDLPISEEISEALAATASIQPAAAAEPIGYMLPLDIKNLPTDGYTTCFASEVTNTTTGERSVPVYTAAPAQAATDEVWDKALEEAATLCETAEIPFDISVWQSTSKQGMSGKTALALAERIRALKTGTPADDSQKGADQ